nr:hypothetical protein Hi04_10k_c361_00020 [uncultured bacterium]
MTLGLAPRSTSFAPELIGSVEPRLWTRPLRELTPDTSYGFRVISFARDVLREPLDPWEEWIVIHAGELLEDGRPRFRTVLLIVARQNGKTFLARVLSLFWLFVEQWPLTLSTSTNLSYAIEAWEGGVTAAEDCAPLAELIAANGIRRTNGEQCLTTSDRCRWRIAASNRKGGRSLSIDRLVLDELREHRDWSAWNAAVPAMNARPFAQCLAITNQGDDESVVLNSLRDSALLGTDPRLGLFEYSAPDGIDVMDTDGWIAANPNLGNRLDVDTIRGAALRANERGGEEEAGFRTEVLCQRVRALNAGVDPSKWNSSSRPGNFDDIPRRRINLCLDISPDGLHATLSAAAQVREGVYRVEVVTSWSGVGCSKALRDELPGWLDKVRPHSVGYFPGGPAAALVADMTARPGFPGHGIKVEALKGETPAVVMGFSDLVRAGQVEHPDDPLMNAHVLSAEKKPRGDGWIFVRRGDGHIDAAYAAAGAVHLARMMPPPRSVRLILPSGVAED